MSAGRGKHRLIADAIIVGTDIIVTIYGGNRPHIGSVAVAVPRPSLINAAKTSSTSSVYNFLSHKDEVIARLFADRLAAGLNCNTVVTAGVHIKNINDEDLDLVQANAGRLCDDLMQKVGRYLAIL
ncbi:MAG: hypothetical protein GY868_09840 [Deltaproteobacteria bacterium]|nr:hypothetical protein [Deltaproteobacteria bacterium]